MELTCPRERETYILPLTLDFNDSVASSMTLLMRLRKSVSGGGVTEVVVSTIKSLNQMMSVVYDLKDRRR